MYLLQQLCNPIHNICAAAGERATTLLLQARQLCVSKHMQSPSKQHTYGYITKHFVEAGALIQQGSQNVVMLPDLHVLNHVGWQAKAYTAQFHWVSTSCHTQQPVASNSSSAATFEPCAPQLLLGSGPTAAGAS
jgi:hypothetical protein